MKNKYLTFIIVLLVTIFTVNALASPIFSPALNIIAKNNKMVKSGLVYNDVVFSKQDFMKCLGISEIGSVTVKSLPSADSGVLKLGTLSVTEGQEISGEFLSVLRFVPAADAVLTGEMVFVCDGTEVPCTVKFLEEVNYAPTFAEESSEVSTYNNVSFFGNIRMKDPEGDKTTLQIVSYPSHGTLSVRDSSLGSYKYTPTNGFVGTDEFIAVACDSYGNYSAAQKISINVEKNRISFSDTVGHWCENAAITVYKKGYADAIKYENELSFCPDLAVSREEFVTMVMKSLTDCKISNQDCSFADSDSISIECRPFVAAAQNYGYINGKNISGEVFFDPKGNITKAEAAVVINNILEIEEGEYVSVFAGDGAIPTWAKTAVYALTSAGVFNGNGEGEIAPSAVLSRAETVQMIYNIIK